MILRVFSDVLYGLFFNMVITRGGSGPSEGSGLGTGVGPLDDQIIRSGHISHRDDSYGGGTLSSVPRVSFLWGSLCLRNEGPHYEHMVVS